MFVGTYHVLAYLYIIVNLKFYQDGNLEKVVSVPIDSYKAIHTIVIDYLTILVERIIPKFCWVHKPFVITDIYELTYFALS